MDRKLLEAVLSHDMEKTSQEMILPSRDFVGGSYPYKVDLEADAVNYENLTIKIDVWMNNILSFDSFTDKVNKFIHEYEKEYGYAFDYVLFDELVNEGYDLRREIAGYTYNDPDNCRLTRDIHFTTFYNNDNGDYYVIMMVHYGADARAGFSDAVCFRLDDFDYFFLSMELHGYTESGDANGDIDLEWFEIEDVATYDDNTNTWYHNETNEEINIMTSANGW